MPEKQRFGEKLITKAFSRFPFVAEMWAKKFEAERVDGIPWTPLEKEISRCKIGIVTTAGVHLKNQQPFDMEDVDGDSTFREVPRDASKSEITITHKYYDHTDADRDINIVFPINRLLEMKERGEIGELAEFHYSFMGHILGRHLKTLVEETGPEVARKLKSAGVDVALLTPG
ncbi:MAG: hypothetical protein HY786_01855 [Deltaproteobacteria bacterium]|nr:hypothetical protein [Deltaproteobacteria bacterium]